MEDDAVDYVRQIIEALRFMHERNVVHLGLKVGGTRFLFVRECDGFLQCFVTLGPAH